MRSRFGFVRAPLVAGAVIVAGAGGALAQRDDPGLQMNCAGDYFRLCAGANPDGPEVEACFQRNMSRLSAKCRAAIGTYDRSQGGDSSDTENTAQQRPRRR